MKISILSGIVLILITVSGAAHAVRTQTAGVFQVIASSDGGAVVKLNAPGDLDTTGAVCDASRRYQIPAASAAAKGHLAVLLTAKASDANVQLDIDDCATFPGIAPEVLNVILK